MHRVYGCCGKTLNGAFTIVLFCLFFCFVQQTLILFHCCLVHLSVISPIDWPDLGPEEQSRAWSFACSWQQHGVVGGVGVGGD